jgi:predicted ATP-grasp superfamily ATP-dependent carboligase
LTDKGRFADAMVHLGLPHPQTMVLRTPDDLRALGPEVSRDWFLKPRASLAFMTRFGVKAFRFTSLAEAWDLVARAREAGVEMMLQEYIPGPPTCHYLIEGFMDRTGAIRTRFARQRLRAAPPDFGDSSYMVSVPLGEVGEAREILEALLQKLRYRGIFQGEFKRDPRDGRFKLLEVNVRPYGEIGFAAACGVDLCEMAYRDALGLPVPTNAEYVVGRRGIIPTLDWKSCWREVRERRITPWSALGSWAGASQPFFAWDDPVPPLVDLWQAAQRRLGRTLRGLHRPPP